jgi:PIN domain nuclease of toxin-antitoxin system
LIHLDTNAALRAYGQRSRLSSPARRLMGRESCQLSPMVLLEFDMLFEIGRITHDATTILAGLSRSLPLTISDAPFPRVIEFARSFGWTRDPFDRLIVANAMADGARLITANATILTHFEGAVW